MLGHPLFAGILCAFAKITIIDLGEERLSDCQFIETLSFLIIDIDECLNGTLNDCHPLFAVCNNTHGSYNCSCLSGYDGEGVNCTDINECLDDPCHSNATCTNTDSSFECHCLSGYIGDGMDCSGNAFQ